MTQKSCAVGMRNAILRNHLKQGRLFKKRQLSQLLTCRFADSKMQKEAVIPQDNASVHSSFAADHHVLLSGAKKHALQEDGKPEVTSIDVDESSGVCETHTPPHDVRNEFRRKRPRRDLAYDESEKWELYNSPCPAG